MWALLSAFGTFLFNLIFRAGVVKFVVGIFAFFVFEWFWSLCAELLTGYTSAGLTTAMGGLANDVLYFMGVMQLHIGLPMILAAYVTRFAVRRIPFIG